MFSFLPLYSLVTSDLEPLWTPVHVKGGHERDFSSAILEEWGTGSLAVARGVWSRVWDIGPNRRIGSLAGVFVFVPLGLTSSFLLLRSIIICSYFLSISFFRLNPDFCPSQYWRLQDFEALILLDTGASEQIRDV